MKNGKKFVHKLMWRFSHSVIPRAQLKNQIVNNDVNYNASTRRRGETLITPRKHNATRGNIQTQPELRRSSKKMWYSGNYVALLRSAEVIGDYYPVLRKLARGYQNISPADLWNTKYILIMIMLHFTS